MTDLSSKFLNDFLVLSMIVRFLIQQNRSNKKAQADFGNALSVLDAHLKGKSFVVNDQVTLADITIACTLLYPFKFVCDKKFLKPYGNVVRWFQACVTEPEFAAVVGKVEMCKSPLKAAQ